MTRENGPRNGKRGEIGSGSRERASEKKPKGASRISTAGENFIFAPPAKNSGQRTS